jgi:hypothetical protein
MKNLIIAAICFFMIQTACLAQGKEKEKTTAKAKDMTPLPELIVANSTAWDKVKEMKSNARNTVEILPKVKSQADSALYESQFSTSSFIGSVIYETGGILVDHGWIRILGSGSAQLNRSLPEWNRGKATISKKQISSFLLVADDVMGGFFGLKLNEIDNPDSCIVYYFGPNSLKWKPIGLNYRTFLSYCFSGNIKRFYDDFRWTGWEEEIKQIDGNHVISCFPLLWTREGLNMKANRKVVAIQKVWDNYPQQTKFLAEQN